MDASHYFHVYERLGASEQETTVNIVLFPSASTDFSSYLPVKTPVDVDAELEHLKNSKGSRYQRYFDKVVVGSAAASADYSSMLSSNSADDSLLREIAQLSVHQQKQSDDTLDFSDKQSDIVSPPPVQKTPLETKSHGRKLRQMAVLKALQTPDKSFVIEDEEETNEKSLEQADKSEILPPNLLKHDKFNSRTERMLDLLKKAKQQ